MMTEHDFREFVHTAEKRNKLMPQIIEEDRVFWRRDPKKMARTLWLCRNSVSSLIIHGIENLQEVASRHKNGEKITFTNRHEVDLDHILRRMIYEQAGVPELSDDSVYPAGLKMIERPWVNFFMSGEHSLMTLTPFDMNTLHEGNRYSSQHEVGEKTKEIVKTYRKNCHIFNDKSGETMNRLIEEGYILSVYPEATRSKTGFLGRAPKAVEAYLQPGQMIVPVATRGFNYTYPVGRIPRWFPMQRSDVLVTVGTPYSSDDLWNTKLEGISYEDKTKATIADAAMARIAVLQPELVTFQDQVFYGKLLANSDGYKYHVSKVSSKCFPKPTGVMGLAFAK